MLLELIITSGLSATAALTFAAPRSKVSSYAALGDSYASGDGAGSSKLLPNFDISCGRFSGAYPVHVANETSLAISPSSFKNLACGGSSTTSVSRWQVPLISDSDVVTLTVGGNEVDFFVLLNECVHQWRPYSSCEAELDKSRSLIESTGFISSYGNMIRGIMEKLKPNARLLVTGYATFFNEESDQCSHISFSRTKPDNLLTKSLRREFNNLVRLLNDVISSTCAASGAEYIDINQVFEGHRFCERGVVEPSKRDETWFFNIDYDDNSGLGSDAIFVTQEDHQKRLPGPIKDFFDLTRTFHPTDAGHRAIANCLVAHMTGSTR